MRQYLNTLLYRRRQPITQQTKRKEGETEFGLPLPVRVGKSATLSLTDGSFYSVAVYR